MTFWMRLPLLAVLAFLTGQARAEWQAIEKVEPYAVAGTTGPALYASIGKRGPKAGSGRAIAYTNFKLTWSRKYVPKGNDCTLVSARPKLIITYTLPEPAERLSGATCEELGDFHRRRARARARSRADHRGYGEAHRSLFGWFDRYWRSELQENQDDPHQEAFGTVP